MIIFHEGLPRSGKSYEAMAVRIIPAIAAGRAVVAYVEGIDHARIAELAGVTEDRCRELLVALTRDQLQTVHADPSSGKVLRVEDHLPRLAVDNALIVLDEAQNFWGNRAKIAPELTQFITEHGHRGIDLVLMGQDLRDVSAIWRRRVELKLCFLKLNAMTLPPWAARLVGNLAKPSYSVSTYRHLGGDQFSKAGTSIRAYDPKYFGTYKSFVADDTNTEVYVDKRAQVWSHPMLRYVVPGMVALGIWGFWSAWGFFHPAPAAVESKAAPAPSPAVPRVPAPQAAASAPVATAAPVDQRTPIERRMVELSAKGRIRLAGLISSKTHTSGVVEWVQGGTVVIERLSLDALRALGVAVLVTENTVQLASGDFHELATPWPLEDMGRVSDARQSSIRGPQQLAAASPLPSDLGGGAPRTMDLPGSLSKPGDPDAGSLPRRVRRVAQ
jgi:zona occludens toxin